MRRLPVLVAMLTTLLVPVPGSAQAEQAPPVTQVAAPDVRKVHREYGDGPVLLNRRDRRLQITFDGRHGDRVRLETLGRGRACATIRLCRGGSLVHEGRSGYHRLRRSGEHRFSFDPCRRRPTGVQLTKLLEKDLRTDGPRLSLPRRVGYRYAARVTVPRDDRLLVRTDTPRPFGKWWSIVAPGKPERRLVGDYADQLFFDAGQRPTYGSIYVDDPELPRSRAGDHYLLIASGEVSAEAMTPTRGTVVVDGEPVDTEVDAERPRPVELSFAGSAGQLVYPETLGDDVSSTGHGFPRTVLAPSGRPVRLIAGLYRLPSTGVYAVYFTPPCCGSFQGPLTVRVRTPLPVAPMAADGSVRTFVSDPPGRRQVALLPLNPDQRYFFERRSDRTSASWFAAVQSPGAADIDASLSPSVAGLDFVVEDTGGESLLVVHLGAGGGEVDLAVTPLTP